MEKRISIEECIECLELQLKILNEREFECLPKELVDQLLYDEHSKEIIANREPDELIYEDISTINNMLKSVISISNVYVETLNSGKKANQIQITDFQVGSNGTCKLLYYNNGVKIKEYLLNVGKMIYSKSRNMIFLELKNILQNDEEYIAYSETEHGFGNIYPRIYFSRNEKLIISRKMTSREI